MKTPKYHKVGELQVDIHIGEGHSHIIVEGHAATVICAFVSAIMQTAAMGIRAVSLAHPEHFRWFQWVWPDDNAQIAAPDAVIHTAEPSNT